MANALSRLPPMRIPHPPVTAPPSTATLAWMFRAARAVHDEPSLRGLSGTATLFLRLLEHRSRLGGWHAGGASPLHRMLALRPSLVSIVQRPYISTGWDAARRIAAIEEHYGRLRGPARGLWLEPWAVVRLATVASRSSTLEVTLDSPHWFVHEGELSLNLFHRGERIYSLAFSLGCDRGEPVAYVGALQGLGYDHALRLYRRLTHDLHGLRPRDLLITAFRTLCREIGLRHWLAVGNRHRVSCSAYFDRPVEVRSNYDDAWAGHGGVLREDGFHSMAVEAKRRCHGEIPSRKRSAYRQRYEMLDRLDAELAASLSTRAASLAVEDRSPQPDGFAPRPPTAVSAFEADGGSPS